MAPQYMHAVNLPLMQVEAAELRSWQLWRISSVKDYLKSDGAWTNFPTSRGHQS